jgi:magnesium-transporting ATPase (P-type)
VTLLLAVLLYRLGLYGRNELAAPSKTSLFELIAEQFEDRLVQILVAVAVVSSVLSLFEDDPTAFVEPVVIILILVINALVGIWQGRSAEGALDALKKVSCYLMETPQACLEAEGL